jgi:hypothetical protein
MNSRWLLVGLGVTMAFFVISAFVVFGGTVPVAATIPHSAPVKWLLRRTLESSIRSGVKDVKIPSGIDLRDHAFAEKAFGHYSVACTPCHGAPGVQAAPWLVLNPDAPKLAMGESTWSDVELFWIIKNGIRMTGMPALGPTHSDDILWSMTAFVRQLPAMTADEYRAMEARYHAAKQHADHHHHGM